MMNDKEKDLIKKKFEIASGEFDFCFISPYCVNEQEELSFFGYLFRGNNEKGVVIDIISDVNEIDERKREYCSQNQIFYSQLFIDPLIGEYNRSYFGEMLKDWKFEF